MIDTVLFDLDGTLLNTIADLHASVNYALQYHQMPIRSRQEVLGFVGNGIAKLIERAVPSGMTAEQTAPVLDTFRQHYLLHGTEHTQPYERIVPMLTEIRAMGYKIAVVSNKLHEATVALCDRFFPRLIDTCVGMSDDLRGKPAPDMPAKAMQQLHADAAHCVYVGDSDVDILTAKAVGVRCLSVTWGFRPKTFLAENGADVFIDKPADIVTWLKLHQSLG